MEDIGGVSELLPEVLWPIFDPTPSCPLYLPRLLGPGLFIRLPAPRPIVIDAQHLAERWLLKRVLCPPEASQES